MERADADAGAAATVALPEVRELALGAGGVTDRSLRDARIRERFGVTVVAIRRADGLVLNPPPDTMLRAGDVVRVFGLTDQIERSRPSPDGRHRRWGARNGPHTPSLSERPGEAVPLL